MVYEVLSLDSKAVAHSVHKNFEIKFGSNKCNEIDFMMPDFSQSGMEFTLFQDSPQFVELDVDFGGEDVSGCNLDFSFVGITHM